LFKPINTIKKFVHTHNTFSVAKFPKVVTKYPPLDGTLTNHICKAQGHGVLFVIYNNSIVLSSGIIIRNNTTKIIFLNIRSLTDAPNITLSTHNRTILYMHSL